MGDTAPAKKPNFYYTTESGLPIKDPQATLRVGAKLQGVQLLQDINQIEIISHLVHERVPERVVHAKGAGAKGYFEVTSDISAFTSADFLSTVGKRTELRSRFSTTAGLRGSADSVRDTRGFAFKLYTDEGNLDWAFLSVPVFPIRDGGKFPSFVHAQKGTPKNLIFDTSTFWEFFNANSEAFHALLMIFTDSGTPQGYQFANIFSLNTYRFTKDANTFFYVKIFMKPKNGVKNFTRQEATKMAGEDPDFLGRSLFNAIEDGKKTGDFPEWEVSAQIIPPNEAEKYPVNIFDPTKTISQKDYPLIPFGKIVLNENPTNYFQEVEQVAFCPTSIVPGWDITADPILQTRLFAYGSAARYRVSANFMQNTANRPRYHYNPTIRDGSCIVDNLGSLPNYIPGDQDVVQIVTKPYEAQEHNEWVGRVTAFDSVVTPDDYVQPREFWLNVLDKKEQDHLVGNLAASIVKARKEVQLNTFDILKKINKDLGDRVEAEVAVMASNPTASDVVNHFIN
ncbi:uncharacterized protein Z520_03142 [Fonsecaea multimorphosa CBS 102226]|uniref:Catalase core domain-containing protein n=1 Tax=Fonsecaea multimorphosa CBS 102226 TaxID=1442371 RepID=A0A0D2KE44_9EURO|nr:uncharacterized protein Z520_03142 [Fonsecaea multimorphosa CBS 102226]KIY01590.1 hypothetical protein Z520_03142 [Fonsecaea multimorphosa CBS 102226]